MASLYWDTSIPQSNEISILHIGAFWSLAAWGQVPGLTLKHKAPFTALSAWISCQACWKGNLKQLFPSAECSSQCWWNCSPVFLSKAFKMYKYAASDLQEIFVNLNFIRVWRLTWAGFYSDFCSGLKDKWIPRSCLSTLGLHTLSRCWYCKSLFGSEANTTTPNTWKLALHLQRSLFH